MSLVSKWSNASKTWFDLPLLAQLVPEPLKLYTNCRRDIPRIELKVAERAPRPSLPRSTIFLPEIKTPLRHLSPATDFTKPQPCSQITRNKGRIVVSFPEYDKYDTIGNAVLSIAHIAVILNVAIVV